MMKFLITKMIHLFNFALILNLLVSCGKNQDQHSIQVEADSIKNREIFNSKTISDKIIEYGYTISGIIELPLNKENYLLSHYLDLKRELLAHPEDKENSVALNKILSDDELFLQNFNSTYKDLFPFYNSESEEMNVKALQYWVSKQIKFTSIPLDKVKKLVMLSVKNIKIDSKSIVVDKLNQKITLNYTAFCDGIRNIDSNGNSTDINKVVLSKGDTVKVPKNIFGLYFKSFDPSGDFYKKNAPLLSKMASRGDESSTFISNIFNQRGEILCTEKGKWISPFNYFYYFDYSNPNCKIAEENYTELNVEDVTAKGPDYSIYPEYHRLFEDQKVNFFAYFNSVGNEAPKNVNALLKNLISNGYTMVSDLDGEYKLKKVISPLGESRNKKEITFNVTIILAEKLKENSSDRFSQAISEEEIVVYDGHAGHGANINEYFTKPSKYPKETYQIIFLNGCQTYFYGVSEILSSKAIRDFDFDNLNVDLISTHSSSHMNWKMKSGLLKTLEDAAKIYSVEEKRWAPKDRKDLSWYGIISNINKLDTANAYYLVSGEQKNDYRPGSVSFKRNIDNRAMVGQLKEILQNSLGNMSENRKYFDYLLESLISKSESLTDLKNNFKNLCLEFPEEKFQVLLDRFYTESCDVRSYEFSSPFKVPELGGVTLPAGSTLSWNERGQLTSLESSLKMTIDNVAYNASSGLNFYPNGKVESGNLTNEFSLSFTSEALGVITLSKGSYVEFYENGKVKQGNVSHEIKDGDLRLSANQYLTFDSEKGSILNDNKKGFLLVDKIIENIPMSNGTYLEYYQFKVSLAKIENNFVLFSQTFNKGTSVYFSKTYLDVCSLVSFTYQDIPIKGGPSESGCAKFSREGNLLQAKLEKDYTYKGLTFLSGTTIFFEYKDKKGYLSRGTVANGTEIDSIKYFKGTSPIQFHPNFKVSSGQLFSNTKSPIEGITLLKKSFVRFRDDGSLIEGKIAEETLYRGVLLGKESFLKLYPNGDLLNGKLAKESLINGASFQPQMVSFHKNGQIQSGYLAKDFLQNGILFKASTDINLLNSRNNSSDDNSDDDEEREEGEMITFYENGIVKVGVLAKDQDIDGFPIKGETWITLSLNGKLQIGVLSKDFTIQGHYFKADSEIKIESDGSVSLH